MVVTLNSPKHVVCQCNHAKPFHCPKITCHHHHVHSAESPSINRRQTSILLFGALSFIQSPAFAYQVPDPTPQSSSTTSIPASASVCQIWDTTLPIPTKQAILSNINRPLGNGSGFIYDQEGHIITNWHVLQNILGNKQLGLKLAPNALVARVFLPSPDGSERQVKYDALLVGQDRRRDIVVLKIKDANVNSLLPPPLPLSTQSPPLIGQDVLAVGNPLGFQNIITTGKIIQLGRPFASLSGGVVANGIQHTASLNPGSSGGPLLNAEGTVVLGINTAIQSKSGTFEGVSLAIPANTVAKVVDELIRYGRPQRAILGIKPATEQVAAALKIDTIAGSAGGVLVQSCITGGPADIAGVLPTRRSLLSGIVRGDVIVEIDGKRVENVPQLVGVLDDKSVGEMVVMKVVRDGSKGEVEVRCTLGLDGGGDGDDGSGGIGNGLTDELVL